MGISLCSLPVPVDMAAGQVRATTEHHWLTGLAGRVAGALAKLGAGCPMAGLSCCWEQQCTYHHVLHASSERHTRAKSAIYDCLVNNRTGTS